MNESIDSIDALRDAIFALVRQSRGIPYPEDKPLELVCSREDSGGYRINLDGPKIAATVCDKTPLEAYEKMYRWILKNGDLLGPGRPES